MGWMCCSGKEAKVRYIRDRDDIENLGPGSTVGVGRVLNQGVYDNNNAIVVVQYLVDNMIVVWLLPTPHPPCPGIPY